MRILSAFAIGLLSAVALAGGAVAQTSADFPLRPVKLVVPFAAGGPTDVVARILADLLTVRWGGQSVVIENRPGAGTIVATAAVAKAPADGHTLLVGTNSLLINPAIGQKLPYDTEKDLAAVSMVATQPVALVANKSSTPAPFRNSWSWRRKALIRSTSPRRARAASATLRARCSSSAPASP
jgi:tripartite-type tricarboxylate transporter receptor subunit TctC